MKTDRIIVVCILLLAALYWFAIGQIREPSVGDPIGPRAIPKLLAIGLVISAVLLWLETVARKNAEARRQSKANEGAAPEASASGSEADGNADTPGTRPIVLAALVGATLIYFFLFKVLGYALATAAYLFVLMMVFNPRKTLANSLTAVGFSLGSYLAFTRVFGAQLPAGLLPF